MLSTKTDTDFSHCYGCGLCTLVCPLWHQGGDVNRTPQGFSRALQAGGKTDRAAPFDCLLCGACEVVCPQNIDTVELVLALRRGITDGDNPLQPQQICGETVPASAPAKNCCGRQEALLLADEALLKHLNGAGESLLEQAMDMLNLRCCVTQVANSGDDISRALQHGEQLQASRLDAFLAPLRGASKLIVSDGLLKRALQAWLPHCDVVSLGFALSNLPQVREQLTPGDLYLIESRAYHADFKRLVDHYDTLGRERGCNLNLDLQRLAIPSGVANHLPPQHVRNFDDAKQSQWIVQGREVKRIVVECIEELPQMANSTGIPVIHIAELTCIQ